MTNLVVNFTVTTPIPKVPSTVEEALCAVRDSWGGGLFPKEHISQLLPIDESMENLYD